MERLKAIVRSQEQILSSVVATMLIWFSTGCAISAQPIDWVSELSRVSNSAEAYRALANEAGEYHLGTMFQGIGFHRHRCFVLGTMLGETDHIAQLAEPTEPPDVTGDSAYDMLLFSASLENLALAIRVSLEDTPSQRANTWNRECVGDYNIPAIARVESPDPAATLTSYGHHIHVEGSFEVGFAQRFAAALQQQTDVDTILLSSAGGSLVDAVEVGRLIRDYGLRTSVSGSCLAECALVLMAGLDREIYRGHNRVGFSPPTSPSLNPTEVEAFVRAYLTNMNMEADQVWEWMTSAELSRDENGVYIADYDQLCSALVTTFIVDFGRCW